MKLRTPELVLKAEKEIPIATEVPLSINGKEIPFKAITSAKDNTDVFNVVSKTYQLIQHKDVWNAVSKLKKYKIVESRIIKGGRIMMIELVNATETNIEVLPKDFYQPRVRIFNSYDATRALSAQAFAIRLICTNGAVGIQKIGHHYKAHTHENINLKELTKFVEEAMAAWNVAAPVLRESAKFMIEPKQALAAIGKFPKKYAELALKQCNAKQDTLYNVWNAFTNIVTHQMKGNVATTTLVKYQSRVNRVFNLLNRPDADPIISDPHPRTESGRRHNSPSSQ